MPGWRFAVAFSAAAAAACYLNALENAFVFDDTLAIVNNPDIRPGAPLADLLLHDFWGKALEKEDSHKSYRPLTVLSFRAHTLWTGREAAPRYFHAVNVVLHAATAACVAGLGAWLWPRRNADSRHGGGATHGARPRPRVALLAGLLFAAHPVHVEAVTGVVGRAELLCALFCFASVAAYGRCASGGRARSRLACVGYGACVPVWYALAVLSKETGVTVLGVLGAIELCEHLPRGCIRLGMRRALRANVPTSVVRVALVGACAVAYAAMRLLLMRPAGAPLSFASASLSSSELIRRAEVVTPRPTPPPTPARAPSAATLTTPAVSPACVCTVPSCTATTAAYGIAT
jgi:hypothetical protein